MISQKGLFSMEQLRKKNAGFKEDPDPGTGH
jgi:hypothetical protein